MHKTETLRPTCMWDIFKLFGGPIVDINNGRYELKVFETGNRQVLKFFKHASDKIDTHHSIEIRHNLGNSGMYLFIPPVVFERHHRSVIDLASGIQKILGVENLPLLFLSKAKTGDGFLF